MTVENEDQIYKYREQDQEEEQKTKIWQQFYFVAKMT